MTSVVIPVLEAGTVGPDPEPLSLSGTPPTGTQGQSYSWLPTITGGTPPFIFELAPPLPAESGLSLVSSTGRIQGTSPSPVTYSGTLSASDGRLPNARTAELPIAFEIEAEEQPPAPDIWQGNIFPPFDEPSRWRDNSSVFLDVSAITRDSNGFILSPAANTRWHLRSSQTGGFVLPERSDEQWYALVTDILMDGVSGTRWALTFVGHASNHTPVSGQLCEFQVNRTSGAFANVANMSGNTSGPWGANETLPPPAHNPELTNLQRRRVIARVRFPTAETAPTISYFRIGVPRSTTDQPMTAHRFVALLPVDPIDEAVRDAIFAAAWPGPYAP